LAIENLQRQIERLTEQFILMKRARYGSKSEKYKYIARGQLNIFNEDAFNEAEAEENPDSPEPEIIIVKPHERKKKRTKAELAKELPVKEEVIDIPENERICNICHSDVHPIGREFVRRELSIIPAQAYVTETYRVNYACDCCAEETDEANIIKPVVPAPVVKRGLASPSSAAHVIYQKFVNSMPLYRQQADWKNFGVNICRGTLANWIIYTSKHWLKPLWESLKEVLLTAYVICADDYRNRHVIETSLRKAA
jgi:transposase